MFRRFVSSSLRRILFGISDLGIFAERDNEITLTAWGDLLVNTWLGFWLDESEEEKYRHRRARNRGSVLAARSRGSLDRQLSQIRVSPRAAPISETPAAHQAQQ
jgi:hypothetical protein